MNIRSWLEKQNTLFWVIIGIVGLAGSAALDFLTGYEWVWSLLYLAPIALITWYAGRDAGLAASIVGGLVAYLLDLQSGPSSTAPAVFVWNGVIRLGFFLAASLLVVNWKKAHLHAKSLIRIDSLTGAANARYFSELVGMEVERTRRTQRPFTIACMGLTDFKALSGSLSMSAGDDALRAVAARARSTLRKVDVVARLAGDQFAFLLPETAQLGSQTAMTRLQTGLLDEMRKNNWSVNLSMGVITCLKAGQSGEELIRSACQVMDAARQGGNNAIEYADDGGE